MASAACTPGPASRLMAILLSSHKEVLFVGNSFVTRFSRYFTREIIIVYVFPAVWWWRPHRGGGRTSLLSLHSGGCSLPLHECVRMFYPDVHCFLSLAVDSPISPSFPNSLSHFFSIIVGYGEYVSHLLLHLCYTYDYRFCCHVLWWDGGCVCPHIRALTWFFWFTMRHGYLFQYFTCFCKIRPHVSHHPSPPYLVFQVQHIVHTFSIYAFTSVVIQGSKCVYPFHFLCLRFTYLPHRAYPFTVIIGECCTWMCICVWATLISQD